MKEDKWWHDEVNLMAWPCSGQAGQVGGVQWPGTEVEKVQGCRGGQD